MIMLVPVSSLWEAQKPRRPKSPGAPKSPNDPSSKDKDQDQVRQQAASKKASQGVSKTAAKKAASAAKRKATVQKKKKAEMKAALAANKAKRQADKAARKKKKDSSGTSSKGSKSAADHVPAQIAHCMLALTKKRGKSTKAAWNICRWAMTKYGYLKGPYRVNTKLPKATKQTQKGTRRSFQHGMEKGPLNKGVAGTGTTKYRKFKSVFRSIEKDVTPKKGL